MIRPSATPQRFLRARRVLVWIGLPALAGVFLLLAGSETLPASLAYAQIAYLVAPSLFATFSTAAAWASAPQSRHRAVWSLLAVAAWALFAREAATGYTLIIGGLSASWERAFDVASAAAFLLLILAATVAGATISLNWRRAVRVSLDSLALAAVLFALTFKVVSWAETLGMLGENVDVVKVTAFAAIGLSILVIDAAVSLIARPQRMVWSREIGAGVAVFALAVVAWAYLGLPDMLSFAPDDWPRMIISLLFLSGYHVMFVAAYLQVTEGGGTETIGTRRMPPVIPSPAVGITVSTLLFVGTVWLGYSLISSPLYGISMAVYSVALLVNVLSMVGHTFLEGGETAELVRMSKMDHVSGVLGFGALDERLQMMLEEARSTGHRCVVMMVDLDDFSSINALRGFTHGDSLLREVASGIARVAGPQRAVFRLSGDGFLVAGPVEGGAVVLLGNAVLMAVRGAGVAHGLTASIGYALYPEHGGTQAELMRNADRAKVWAKRHGKKRVVAYDDRLGDALGFEERLTDEEASSITMVRALCSAADARDPANRHHSRNVASLVRLMAEGIGMDDSHIRRLEMAAMLHDVGKIALPDQMLGGTMLSARERRVVREHSVLGERLTESLGIESVPMWVRAHHERWDGHGYPDGLTGVEIPLESRIIALADAYDGMTVGKRYGAPMSKAAALQEVDLGIGTRFDPELAERFIELVGSMGALGWSDDWSGDSP